MAKGRRKRVGEFKAGDEVVFPSGAGTIRSFPSRRIAIVEKEDGEYVEVSVLDLEKREVQ